MELPPRTRVAVSSMEETPGSSKRRMAGRMGEHLMVDCERWKASIMEHLLREKTRPKLKSLGRL